MSFAEASDQQASHFLPSPSMLYSFLCLAIPFSASGCAKTSDFRHALAPYILRTPQGPLIFASTVARYKIVCTFWLWLSPLMSKMYLPTDHSETVIQLERLAPEMITAASPRGVGCPSLHLTLLGE